jgi:hypothetical protein
VIKIRTLLAGLSAALVSSATLISSAAAVIQDTEIVHTWVSRTGVGTACTFAEPCASFATAQKVTLPGGVISVLDAGDYGSITVTKSITIRAEGVDGGATDQTMLPSSSKSRPALRPWWCWMACTSAAAAACISVPADSCKSSDA